MNEENVLTTIIRVEGSFRDCQLYSGKLYLWNHQNELLIYNWNKWLRALSGIDRPIYFEPQPSEQLSLTIEDLYPFLERTVPFAETVADSAIFNHTLYYSDTSGFYRYPLDNQNAVKEQLWEVPVSQISLSRNGRMALAAGKEGLFEYLLSSVRSYIDQENSVTSAIYRISPAFTSKAEWEGQDLIQFGKSPFTEIALLLFKEEKGQIHLIETIPAEDLQDSDKFHIQRFPLSLSLNGPALQEASLFSYTGDNDQIKKDAFYRSKTIHLRKEPSPLVEIEKEAADEFPLTVQESPKGLTVAIQGKPSLDIPASQYSHWRIYSRTRNYRNQLHVITANELFIYVFTELER